MADRLPLAPNSVWDGAAILEPDVVKIQVLARTPEPLILLRDTDCELSVYPQDVRAILHANGYLPEVDELAKLIILAREMSDQFESMLPNPQCSKPAWDALVALQEFLADKGMKDG